MANLPQGTGFTNLQKIITANSNNQLGNTIQGGVQKNVSGLQNNINQSQQQFQTDVNSANTNTDANNQYVTNTIGGIANATPQTPAQPAQVTAPSNAASTAPAANQGVTAQQNQQNLPSGTVSALSDPTNTAAGSSSNPIMNTPARTGGQNINTTPAASSDANLQAAPAQHSTSNSDSSNLAAAPGSFGYASNATSGATQTNMQGQGFNAPTAGDISKFGTLLQGNYSGPNQLNNYQALQAQGQNLQNQGQNIGTQGGLQSLLQQYVGGNNYTQGQQTLDTLLLGQTAQPQLKNIAQTLQNVASLPQNAEAQAQALAQQTATGNQNFAQNIRGQLGSAENPILQNVTNNLDSLSTQNQTYQNAAQQVYNYLNNPLATSYDATGNPTTPQEATTDALNLAAKYGMINTDTINAIQQQLPTIQSGNGNIQQALQGAFNFTPGTALPQYTVQQGANSQQAAQLNALNLLGQQGNTFGTYGGLALPSYGFDASKLPAGGTPVDAAGNPIATGNANRGFLYDFANSATSPAIVPVSAALSGVGQGISSSGRTIGDLAKGDIGAAANSAISTPSNVVGGVTNSLNGGLDSATNSLNNLLGNVPLGSLNSGVFNAANSLGQTPLTALNSGLGAATNGVTGAISDIGKGNIGAAANDALQGLTGSIMNPINDTVNGVSGAVSDVGQGVSHAIGEIGKVLGGGGTWFCTELFKRRLLTQTELFEMSKFFLLASVSRTNMVLFYSVHGPAIVKAANKNKINWQNLKTETIDKVLKLKAEGKHKESREVYSQTIKNLCLAYSETNHLWNDSLLQTTFSDKIKSIVPLLRTESFHIVCKIYVRYFR